MNLKRQLEMQRRYAAQARGEKPRRADPEVEVVPMSADHVRELPKRKPRKKAAEPAGGE